MHVSSFLSHATRFLFFTGKGGVGKTSLACATAVALAESGKTVLLVSTDPASNLDEVLGATLSNAPTPIPGFDGKLDALNIDPQAAAHDYRERIVAPIRGLLPEATVRNIEEQLSGACTTEIASFNEFSSLLGKTERAASYDHVILDTAPTGHTLRLLALPAAWSDFIATNKSGSTCLGPLAGLGDQRHVYETALATLRDPRQTTVALVSRADTTCLAEAERARNELTKLGINNHALLLNAVFRETGSVDALSSAFAQRCEQALAAMPGPLRDLPRYESPYRSTTLTGIDRIRTLYHAEDEAPLPTTDMPSLAGLPSLCSLIDDLAKADTGVIMTLGKGGVGKTTLAKQIAIELASRGKTTLLTTTDPANHLKDTPANGLPHLTVSSIDPKEATRLHIESILATTGKHLDPDARELLEEELRSPCTEEVAVFTAFAHEIAKGKEQFVVLDTAPTGHTLLLLQATETYHREVLKSASSLPDSTQSLIPRLLDPDFTKVLVVALPEATPVHEAAQLQAELRRAGIEPYAWILNQCINASDTADPRLLCKAGQESLYIEEVAGNHASRYALNPWKANPSS